MLPLLVVLAVAQASSAPPQPAWSSARPPECAAVDPMRASNVWERAKAPELRKYCDLLAGAASKLAGSAAMASDVLALTDQADKTLPGKAAPLVLRGRAHAQLGRAQDALT